MVVFWPIWRWGHLFRCGLGGGNARQVRGEGNACGTASTGPTSARLSPRRGRTRRTCSTHQRICPPLVCAQWIDGRKEVLRTKSSGHSNDRIGFIKTVSLGRGTENLILLPVDAPFRSQRQRE